MADDSTRSSLGDDEVVYRRLPANPQFFDQSTRTIKEVAFRPTPADADGLSLSRQSVGPAGAAASGRMGKAFYVATLPVADIQRLGLTLVADRDDHAVVVDLTYDRRESTDQAVRNRVLKAAADLVAIVIAIDGSFPGQAPPPPPTAPPSPP